jgi:hypothetical protein
MRTIPPHEMANARAQKMGTGCRLMKPVIRVLVCSVPSGRTTSGRLTVVDINLLRA